MLHASRTVTALCLAAWLLIACIDAPPLLVYGETPTPEPTVQPTATPRPSPTPVPTLRPNDPAILELMSLRLGATWIYSVAYQYQEGFPAPLVQSSEETGLEPEEVFAVRERLRAQQPARETQLVDSFAYDRMRPARWTGVVTETITAERQEGKARAYLVERSGLQALELPPHEKTHVYVALNGRLYQLFESQDAGELVRAEGKGFEGEQIVAWPMKLGQMWGEPNLASGQPEMYRWRVAAVEDVSVPAGDFADCYRVVFETNLDTVTNWFCLGTGLVRYTYRHSTGARSEAWELSAYRPGRAP